MESYSLIYAATTGLGLGWLSIPHCYAMCGPLHMSICALNWKKSITSLLLVNTGRIIGYTMAGILFGYFGAFISAISKMQCPHCSKGGGSGYLAYLFPAILMFLISIRYFLKKGTTAKMPGFLQKYVSVANKYSLVIFGLVLTLLPCGMLYVAFAAAVTTSSPVYGGVLMFAFVITHTFFLQLGVIVGKYANRRLGQWFDLLFPWITLFLGLVYLFLFIRHLK